MTLQIVKPSFACLLNPRINTKPSLGFNLWTEKKTYEIAMLLKIECDKNKLLVTGGE